MSSPLKTVKASQQKYSVWIYVVLAGMLLLFIGFFTLPFLNIILEQNRSAGQTTSASVRGLSADQQEELAVKEKGYELVLQREPENAAALRGLLEVKLEQKDLPGAIAVLERLTEVNPQQIDYSILLAQAKQQVADYEGAATTYRNILASNPGEITALQGLVNLLLQQNKPEAAIGLLQDTLKTVNQADADSIDVTSIQLLLGQVYANEQRYPEAIAVYDQAIDNDKQDFRPVLAKAIVLKQQGKMTEAQPLFTTAISLAPPRYKDQIKQLATDVSNPPEAEIPTPEPETAQ
ncbi:MAG: tetratricopeptide repeat protein [Cyanobacteriota bacterium]